VCHCYQRADDIAGPSAHGGLLGIATLALAEIIRITVVNEDI
jgi:hypothetical protein